MPPMKFKTKIKKRKETKGVMYSAEHRSSLSLYVFFHPTQGIPTGRIY